LCGDLQLTTCGEPVLVSLCCCTRCQHRTGSFFGVTAIFERSQVLSLHGEAKPFHLPDGLTTFHFCPTCGTTVWFEPDDANETVIGIAGGTFTDGNLPEPTRVLHVDQRHSSICWREGLEVFPEGP
jgi:hypothetical protein